MIQARKSFLAPPQLIQTSCLPEVCLGMVGVKTQGCVTVTKSSINVSIPKHVIQSTLDNVIGVREFVSFSVWPNFLSGEGFLSIISKLILSFFYSEGCGGEFLFELG